MGLVFGKITVETPKFEVLASSADYEIRKYPPAVAAEVTYDPAGMGGDRDGGFTLLANYIGALGEAQNVKPEKIAMTAPVITKSSQGEKIAMTAPVVTKGAGGGEGEEGKRTVTMQFLLPAKYRTPEEAPAPTDHRVVVKGEGERKYAAVKFAGRATEAVAAQKAEELRKMMERDGHKVTGEFLLARYNPPWTLPPLRTNEILMPVE